MAAQEIETEQPDDSRSDSRQRMRDDRKPKSMRSQSRQSIQRDQRPRFDCASRRHLDALSRFVGIETQINQHITVDQTRRGSGIQNQTQIRAMFGTAGTRVYENGAIN